MQKEIPLEIIRSHTGLRGVAAMWVFLGHIGIINGTSLSKIFAYPAYAVYLFFILSGFVLNYVYLNNDTRPNWRSYLSARFARILPLYYLSTALSFPIYYLIHHCRHGHEPGASFLVTLLTNALMISGILGGPDMTINSPAWSISVEFFCYLAVFPLLTCLSMIPSVKKNNLILSIVLVMLSTRFLATGGPVIILKGIIHWDSLWLWRGVFGFSAGFGLCNLYRVMKAHQIGPLLCDFLSISSLVIVLLGIINLLPINRCTYAMPVLILFTAFDKGFISKILMNKVLQWLGDRSYSIYLLHMLVIGLISEDVICGASPLRHANEGLRTLIMITLVLIISDLSYRFFEIPLRKYIRSK